MRENVKSIFTIVERDDVPDFQFQGELLGEVVHGDIISGTTRLRLYRTEGSGFVFSEMKTDFDKPPRYSACVFQNGSELLAWLGKDSGGVPGRAEKDLLRAAGMSRLCVEFLKKPCDKHRIRRRGKKSTTRGKTWRA